MAAEGNSKAYLDSNLNMASVHLPLAASCWPQRVPIDRGAIHVPGELTSTMHASSRPGPSSSKRKSPVAFVEVRRREPSGQLSEIDDPGIPLPAWENVPCTSASCLQAVARSHTDARVANL